MPAYPPFAMDGFRVEPLGFAHEEVIVRMHQDPEVMATLAGVRSPEETRRWLERDAQHWERYGYGLWVFFDPVTGDFVGRAGLRHVEVDGRDEVEVAYALMSPSWNRGIATAMAKALLDYGFRHLGLPEMIAFTLPTNRASQRVMQKAGMTYERDVTHANLPHVLYRKRA